MLYQNIGPGQSANDIQLAFRDTFPELGNAFSFWTEPTLRLKKKTLSFDKAYLFRTLRYAFVFRSHAVSINKNIDRN